MPCHYYYRSFSAVLLSFSGPWRIVRNAYLRLASPADGILLEFGGLRLGLHCIRYSEPLVEDPVWYRRPTRSRLHGISSCLGRDLRPVRLCLEMLKGAKHQIVLPRIPGPSHSAMRSADPFPYLIGVFLPRIWWYRTIVSYLLSLYRIVIIVVYTEYITILSGRQGTILLRILHNYYSAQLIRSIARILLSFIHSSTSGL